MKNLLLFTVLLFSFHGRTQTWIDTGAVWHYDIHVVPFMGILKYEYIDDEMVGGQMCQHITAEQTLWTTDQNGNPQIYPWGGGYSDQYTYSNGDTVFWWVDDSFHILYDFGADIGDQWMLADHDPYSFDPMCGDTSYAKVVDKGTTVLNSQTYRWIELDTVPGSPLGLSGVYVERFGYTNGGSYGHGGLFPHIRACDPMIIPETPGLWLRCFEDESFTLVNYTNGSSCEFVLNTMELSSEKFEVYPNPSKGELQLSGAGIKEVLILDASGRMMGEYILSQNEAIDISTLSNGLYLVQVTFESGEIAQKKIIKE